LANRISANVYNTIRIRLYILVNFMKSQAYGHTPVIRLEYAKEIDKMANRISTRANVYNTIRIRLYILVNFMKSQAYGHTPVIRLEYATVLCVFVPNRRVRLQYVYDTTTGL
jgi:hypothetical protein